MTSQVKQHCHCPDRTYDLRQRGGVAGRAGRDASSLVRASARQLTAGASGQQEATESDHADRHQTS